MFEPINQREIECEFHGKVLEYCYEAIGTLPERWSGCEACANEKRFKQLEEDRKQEAIDRAKDRLAAIKRKSGVPKRFYDKTFEGFEAITEKAAARRDAVRDYADGLASGETTNSLILVGKVGNGKTHLACALISHIIEKAGKVPKYMTFSELVRSVKESWKSGSEISEADVYRNFAKPDLVVIDEVGIQNFTEFEQTVAYEAINARYLDEKPTVLITNLAAKDLSSALGDRVVDRLREGGGKALDFDWQSYRVGSK